MLGQVLYKKTKPNLSQSYLTQGKHLSWFEEVKDLLRLRISKDLFSFWHWDRSATLATRSMLLHWVLVCTIHLRFQDKVKKWLLVRKNVA